MLEIVFQAIILLPVIGLLAFLLRANVMVHALTAAICLFICTIALNYLGGSQALVLKATLPIGLPWLNIHLRLDALSAFFMLIVNFGGAMAGLYGIGYSKHMHGANLVSPLLPVFIMAMNMVLLADDAFIFLVAWEAMSFSSWFMVLAEHEKEENRKAARIYLIMAAFGVCCLLPAFGLLAGPEGNYAFDAMREVGLSHNRMILVVVLVILGAGSKAGLVPLHAWLPLAHPAAPSHVSGLMSGVMTKVAIYGLIRLLFDIISLVPWWLGMILMFMGGITAVLGILYALSQNDLKKMLAYSTVENIGVIAVALGLALAYKGVGSASLAGLALVAVLYHSLNHAMFKNLLFMGSGAIIAASGEKNLDRMGGLLRRMPVTGFTFLIGAAAISALPPLNGFVSEWLIFQSLFRGPSLPQWAMKFGVPVVGAMMALAAALAATCFVRAMGLGFLGRPRTENVARAFEVGLTMRSAMVILALACIILGVVPVTMTTALSHVATFLTGSALPVSPEQNWPWLVPVSEVKGSYSGTVLVISGSILTLLALAFSRRFSRRTVRRAALWDCGHLEENPHSQYSATSFAQPLRRAFAKVVFRHREDVDMPMPGESKPARHYVHFHDPFWEWLYVPLNRLVEFVSLKVAQSQGLNLRHFLLLMFGVLILMLVIVALRQ